MDVDIVKALRNTLIIITITGAILTAVEFTLRFVFPDKVYNKDTLLSLAYEHNDTYIVSLKPNIEKEFPVDEDNGGGTVLWQTNSFGFRGNEIGGKTGIRIIVYGDSNIQARFTGNDNTYTAVLQDILSAKYKSIEVINAGLLGSGPDQSLIRLVHDIDVINPDIVIFHVFADNDYGDIIRNRLFKLTPNGKLAKTKHRITKDLAITPREDTFINWFNSLLLIRSIAKLASISLDNVVNKLQQQSEIEFDVYRQNMPRQISHFSDHYDIDIAIDPESATSRIKIALMENILIEAERVVCSKERTFLVVIQPSVYDLALDIASKYPSYNKHNLTQPLKKICKKNKLNCIHLIDTFLLNDPGSLYRKNDNHWNDKGQRASAEVTANRIRELLD